MKRVPALDGLRGLAALAVVAHHTGWSDGTIGPLGVDQFYALSGYLCGSLLLGGQPTGKFLTRRILRVLPLYFLSVMASTLLHGTHSQYPAWMLWTMNADLSYALHGYLVYLPEVVLWSVCVEVHVYCLLPFVAKRKDWLLLLVVMSVSLRSVSVALGAGDWGAFFLCRMDGMLLGVLLVHWQRERSPWADRLVSWAPWLLLARLAFLFQTHPLDIWPVEILSPWCAVACVAWITSRERVAWLETPVLVWLGSVSYGIYLIHPFLTERYHGTIAVLEWAVPLAALSWHVYEQPMQRFGSWLWDRAARRNTDPAPSAVHVARGSV